MQPTQELIDDIYREKVERARQMPFDDKLLGGLFLFANECKLAKAGLRAQFPDETEAEIQRRLIAQFDLLESLEPQAWTNIPASEASWML